MLPRIRTGRFDVSMSPKLGFRGVLTGMFRSLGPSQLRMLALHASTKHPQLRVHSSAGHGEGDKPEEGRWLGGGIEGFGFIWLDPSSIIKAANKEHFRVPLPAQVPVPAVS